MNENTTTTTATAATEFYAQNSITGLFFNGTDFSDQKPSKAFDRTEIGFIKATWSNVEPVEVEAWESSCAEGWSLEWFR
jgi:hypothetical protein